MRVSFYGFILRKTFRPVMIVKIVFVFVHQRKKHSHQSENSHSSDKIDSFGETFVRQQKGEQQNKSIDDTNDDYELTELGTIL